MQSRHVTSMLTVALVGFLLVACGQKEVSTPAWKVIGIADVDESAQAQVGRAEAARQALLHDMFDLFGKVFSEEETPNLEICGPEAKAIAMKVAGEKGVKIGRTSFRLRNKANVPPAWAEAYVADKVEEKIYVQNADGRIAALFPLRMQSNCETCHGDPATMDEAVKDLLAEHYPDDEATGFSSPGLRGYLWVEVPATNP